MKLAARIEGIGLVGPGLAGWIASREMLRGRVPYVSRPTDLPIPEALPANERRRAGKSVKLALAAGLEAARAAGRSPRDLVAIFASSSGDGENCHSICADLACDDRSISPTRFHNSVHNAPSGYWGIATGAMRPADCVAAYDASFGAGLLEAMTRLAADPSQPVLAIAYDSPYPEPLNGARPIADSFAVAIALASSASTTRGPTLTLELARELPEALSDETLERMRRGIPAARALPLLLLLAREAGGETVIEYLDGLALHARIEP
jgi:Beta-ketoacyl synthase, N-terminal domain